MMKRISLLSFFLIAFLPLEWLWAQGYEIQAEKTISDEERVVRGDKLKAYRILPKVGMPMRVNVRDSITLGTHGYLTPEHRSLGVVYTGNAISPWQSKIFFDRAFRPNDFIYWNSFEGMQYRPEEVLWYDTKTPFTYIHYHKNLQTVESEEILKGTLSLNLGKALNFGASFHYAGAEGFYSSTRSKDARYRVFGSYQSDRYDAWTYVANDYYKMSESGGITNLEQILDPDKYSDGRLRLNSRDIPTRIPADMLFNRLRSGHGFLSHRYKLGYIKRTAIKAKDASPPLSGENVPRMKDNLPLDLTGGIEEADSNVFVPVASIGHMVYYNKQSRRMISTIEDELWSNIFGTPTMKRRRILSDGSEQEYILPNDTAELTTLANTFSLSLMENFRPWVKFGLSAYLRTENSWVANPDRTTGIYRGVDSFFSTFVGGHASRHTGRGLNFDLMAELGVLGRDLGAFQVDAQLQSQFRLFDQKFALMLDGKFQNHRPAYFMAHHHGTFGYWDEDFGFSRRFDLGGKIDFSSWGTWVDLRTASLQNYLYWGSDARSRQSKDIMQVAMLRLGHKYHLGPLGWDLEAAYQLSSHQQAIPLPALTARADLYLDLLLFRVLAVQLGAEGYWNTAYYAPYYHPGHQQFISQMEYKVGGKAPLINGYANFRLKGIRFYFRMFNLGEVLMKNDRLSAHLYPYNPMHLQAGISVDLDS